MILDMLWETLNDLMQFVLSENYKSDYFKAKYLFLDHEGKEYLQSNSSLAGKIPQSQLAGKCSSDVSSCRMLSVNFHWLVYKHPLHQCFCRCNSFFKL